MGRNTSICIIGIALVVILSSYANPEIYRYRDENGVWHFSNDPAIVEKAKKSPPASGARAIEFEAIRSNMNNMTSIAWDDYTKSLQGQRISWTGWISDVKEQWFGGYQILIDMDPPGSVSVQDVYIENLDRSVASQFRKKQKVRFSGKIKSVMKVLGSCAVTLEDINIK